MTRHRNGPSALAFAADEGAPGLASLARRSLMVPTDLPGVQCRQIIEAGPLAGMRLTQRQADAGAQLARLWQIARRVLTLPMEFGINRDSGRELSPEDEAEAADAYRSCNDALDAVQFALGLRHVVAVRAAILHHEPADQARLLAALTVISDHWRL